jgi:uncharacterized membrane protein YcaP (DUF421 family)
MLVYQGKVNDANMRKARLTTNELLEAIREHGVADISDVDLAVLEVDGNISVLSNDFQRKTTKAIRKSRSARRDHEKERMSVSSRSGDIYAKRRPAGRGASLLVMRFCRSIAAERRTGI